MRTGTSILRKATPRKFVSSKAESKVRRAHLASVSKRHTCTYSAEEIAEYERNHAKHQTRMPEYSSSDDVEFKKAKLRMDGLRSGSMRGDSLKLR